MRGELQRILNLPDTQSYILQIEERLRATLVLPTEGGTERRFAMNRLLLPERKDWRL
jgi:hypothetical protein